jgi:hypothetical protein
VTGDNRFVDEVQRITERGIERKANVGCEPKTKVNLFSFLFFFLTKQNAPTKDRAFLVSSAGLRVYTTLMLAQ